MHLRASLLNQHSPSRSEWNRMVLLPSGLWSLSGCRCRFRRQLWADRLLLDPRWPQCLPSTHLQVQWGWGKDSGEKKTSIYSTCFLLLLIYVCLCQLPSLLWPNSPCPFSYCDDILHVFCICVINTRDLLNNLFTFVMFLQPEAISTFTSEPALVSFAKFFCKTSEDNNYVS